jgi:hypothetical protein
VGKGLSSRALNIYSHSLKHFLIIHVSISHCGAVSQLPQQLQIKPVPSSFFGWQSDLKVGAFVVQQLSDPLALPYEGDRGNCQSFE